MTAYKVQRKIIDEVKKRNIVIIDSMPDISNVNQLFIILRYIVH